MLTVNVNERAAQLFECAQGADAAVEIDAMPTGSGEDSFQDQVGVFRSDGSFDAKPTKERMIVRELERGFHLRFLRSRADLLGRSSPPDQEPDGIDQQRLAAACFTGECYKTGLELKMQSFDERKIRDAQLGEHWIRSRNPSLQWGEKTVFNDS